MRYRTSVSLTPEQAAAAKELAGEAGLGIAAWIASLVEKATGLPGVDSRPGLAKMTPEEKAAAAHTRWKKEATAKRKKTAKSPRKKGSKK